MPMIDADGCLLNVSVDGRDGGPTLMLSNSLGCTLQMWEPQMKALTQVFRVIRYDRRGHGKSQVPDGPYSIERFGKDVLAILNDLNIEKTHWCGLSMGGMVGQWLGANAPERMGKIVLANTACYYADPTNWLSRIKTVKDGGLAAVADAVIANWFTADFRERDGQIAHHRGFSFQGTRARENKDARLTAVLVGKQNGCQDCAKRFSQHSGLSLPGHELDWLLTLLLPWRMTGEPGEITAGSEPASDPIEPFRMAEPRLISIQIR